MTSEPRACDLQAEDTQQGTMSSYDPEQGTMDLSLWHIARWMQGIMTGAQFKAMNDAGHRAPYEAQTTKNLTFII